MSVDIISTVLVAATAAAPADPYDLVTLAIARDELGIPAADTSNDTFLQRAITQSSSAIAKYCNRVFTVEVIEDQIFVQLDAYPYQVPGGVHPLRLSRWPLVDSAAVSFTGNTHANSTVVDGIASTVGIDEGMLVFAADGSIPAGAKVAQVSPKSLILDQAATATGTAVSLNTGLQVVQTTSATSTSTLTAGTDFAIDAKLGALIRLSTSTGAAVRWEAGLTTVRYQAGFEAAPADLQDACLRLVTARFRARGRDPSLVERTQGPQLGTERFWVGTTPGQTGALPPEITALIDQYRVPVIG